MYPRLPTGLLFSLYAAHSTVFLRMARQCGCLTIVFHPSQFTKHLPIRLLKRETAGDHVIQQGRLNALGPAILFSKTFLSRFLPDIGRQVARLRLKFSPLPLQDEFFTFSSDARRACTKSFIPLPPRGNFFNRFRSYFSFTFASR